MGHKKSPVHQAEGITPSERYLNRLSRRSFLSLWSYPGVYRDQGGGKEICDLLVIFERHILIFSDKNCEFPQTGDIETDWLRWFRRAVWKSARQLWGAERWIKMYPDRVYLDRACTQKFPYEIPSLDDSVFHRIVVAHGAAARCQEEFGGSGSLMISSDLIGEKHLERFDDGGEPFTIGQLDPQKGYVHVFDDTTLDIIMSTIDTITDFTAYLSKKEKLIEEGPVIRATGEEDLMAYYLVNLNKNDEHDFVFPSEADYVLIDETHWRDFEKNPQRLAQIRENRISYAWDALIEAFSTHILNDSQYYSSDPDVRSSEKIMRFLAREPRTRRRMLARLLLDLIRNTPVKSRAVRVVLPSKEGDPYYVFLLLSSHLSSSEEEYREVRYSLLEAYCMAVKLEFPGALDIVGISTDTGTGQYRSEDAMYLDARYWPPELEAEARSLQADLDLLTDKKLFRGKEKEYPTE